MLVYAYWNERPEAPPRQAELVALWLRACERAGDTARLLTVRDALRSSRYKLAVKRGTAATATLPVWALRAKKGERLVSLLTYDSGSAD